MTRSTDGYDERLRKAKDFGPHPMSQRALARKLREAYPDLRGTSDAGVRQYLEGKVAAPRVELLRAMADVLEVREDWLVLGQLPADIDAGSGTTFGAGYEAGWNAAMERVRKATEQEPA